MRKGWAKSFTARRRMLQVVFNHSPGFRFQLILHRQVPIGGYLCWERIGSFTVKLDMVGG